MTEKVLAYDHSIVPQETGYWCGPASTQVVLNSRGIFMAEADLARQIGTTTAGTDYVGLIERVLDRVTPDARYTSVEVPTYPNAAVKNRYWDDLVRSINGGYGVVANIVAPPGNKPVGVNGSVSPAYSGGTTFHYIALMGYRDDVPGVGRAVWVADSGFRPFGYWLAFDQLCTLMVPKAFCYADVLGAASPVPITTTPPVAILSQAMGDVLTMDRYAQLLPAFRQSLADCGCDTVNRVAMYCAQVGHESVGLKYMREIASGAEYEGRTDLGNTQRGDGVRFAGRGPIQVTGRHNYTVLSRWAFDRGLVPTPTFFVDQPEQLERDQYGFIGVTWYWTTQRPMNQAADAGDIVLATRYVNGGTHGLADRTARWNRCRAMGSALLQLPGQDWQSVLDYLTGVTP